MTLPSLPPEPEYLGDSWYYQGFSQYLKTEAFEVYYKDRADVLKAWLREAMKYASHHYKCYRVHRYPDTTAKCDCGLDTMREQVEKELK